jgi:hypothetical protein
MDAVKAQGATEYLVLLAVVLIVALVSVALLGFFPGMASDAQIQQSQAYWQSASPVAVVESGARAYQANGNTFLYMRIRNNAAYPIRVTGVVGADGAKADSFYGQSCADPPGIKSIQTYFYMGPGEEKYFTGYTEAFPGMTCDWQFYVATGASTSLYVGGASSVCRNSSASPGTVDLRSIGFEYIAYIDGQQITKRQIGKDFIIKCREPF